MMEKDANKKKGKNKKSRTKTPPPQLRNHEAAMSLCRPKKLPTKLNEL